MSSVTLMARLDADLTGSPPDRKVRAGHRSGQRALQMGHARLFIVAGMLTVIFSVISVRLLILAAPEDSLIRGIAGGDLAHNFQRADIIDRNGEILATSLRVASLYADPHVLLNSKDVAKSLAPLLPNVSEDKLLQLLSSNTRFEWLARRLTPRQQAEILNLGIPGVGFRYEQHRIYPHGSLLAHVVGFTDLDNKGQAGLEGGMNLSLNENTESLQTSLDVRVQYVLRSELIKSIDLFSAVGASGIVMDVTNGEILAMVSLPDFDPNRELQSSDIRMFNRATLGMYEPGSTIKVMTIAMALEYDVASLEQTFDASEPLRVGKYTIHDDHPQNRWLTLPEIFIYSSNIGASRIAMEIGAKRQKDFLKRLGFLTAPSLEINGGELGTPKWPLGRQWGDSSTMTISFGYGIQISQLQMASGFSTIVNGGMKVDPTLLKQNHETNKTRVLSKKTSEKLSELLRLNVSHPEGTGQMANVDGFSVGGKTGTAEKSIPGGYDSKALITSFVGAFPMNNPKYAVLVMLDEPKGIDATFNLAGAGWNAAPTVAKIISRIAPILSVFPELEDKERILVSLEHKEVKGAAF